MKKTMLLFIACISILSINSLLLASNKEPSAAAKKLKNQVTLASNHAFVKDNFFAHRDYKAEAETPQWNKALQEVEKFVQKNSGSSEDHKKLTHFMGQIEKESEKLINTIDSINNTTFGGDKNTVLGSQKSWQDQQWQCNYIQNSLHELINKLQFIPFDSQGKNDCKYLLITVAGYLKVTAKTVVKDMNAEIARRPNRINK